MDTPEVATRTVRFLEDREVRNHNNEVEQAFKAGKAYPLPEASAARWVSRKAAEYVDIRAQQVKPLPLLDGAAIAPAPKSKPKAAAKPASKVGRPAEKPADKPAAAAVSPEKPADASASDKEPAPDALKRADISKV